MGQRRQSREFALQMLFQLDLVEGEPSDAFPAFWETRGVDGETRTFSESLVLGVLAERSQLDDWIRGSAKRWRLERMAAVDRNVLRIAVHELMLEDGPPAPVVIDEAIEIARKFSSEESGSFINGILDDIHRRIRRGEIAHP